MKFRINFGLNAKLMLITVSTILLALTGYVYFNLQTFISVYKESVIKMVFAQAKELQTTIYDVTELGLAFGELEGVNKECQQLVKDISYAKYCFVMDNSGIVYYHNIPDKVGAVYTDPITQKAIKTQENLVQHLRSDLQENIYDFSMPIKDMSGQKIGTIRIGVLSDIIDDAVSKQRKGAIILGFLSILCSIGLLSILYRLNILRPIKILIKGITGLGEGKFDTRVLLDTNDEFGELAKTFNKMADDLQKTTEALKRENTVRRHAEEELNSAYEELKQTQAQLVQSAKMAAVGQLGAGVSHELNNPLGGILGYAQFILEKLRQPDFSAENFKSCQRYIETIERESTRCKKIVETLLTFSRRPISAKPEPIDLRKAIEEVLFFTGHQLKLKNVKVVTDFKPDLAQVSGIVNQLQQVFTNLTLNAQQAMPDGGELRITAENLIDGPSQAPSRVKIEFADTGCGIPAENLGHIFEPFFTTKAKEKGTGLGLSLSYQIIQDHKGVLEVKSQVGQGTVFTVILPTCLLPACR